MKKITSILLVILILVSILASCGGNNETTTTEIPTTEAPTTEIPTIEMPTTEIPTTEVPTTEAPTTEAPTTETPTTETPTTDNNNNDNVENPWDSICITGTSLTSSDSRFNYKNIIDTTKTSFDDSDNVPSKVTININGEDIMLDYVDSYYYLERGVFINRYYKKISEASGYYVHLYEDGTIYFISESEGFASIEIPENATSEVVLSYAKEFLSQFTDLSQCNRVEHKKNIDSEKYTFKFYREVDGYITEKAEIDISAEGKVSFIRITKIQDKITSLNVDKEKTEELLIKKIKDTYTTDFVEFISCEINKENIHAYIINDKIYFWYYCNVKYKFRDGSEEFTTERSFLVPYELVKAEE